jgi:putative ABC transport system permease protein
MLLDALILCLLVVPFTTWSAIGMRHDLGRRWYLLLLVIGPVIDAWLVLILLQWLQMSGPATWGCALVTALLSHILMQPLLSPRRLLIWRLALQQVTRRKRQTALMMAGLLIASAIITSSLVVGDSLDSTIKDEIESSWDNTDILIYAKDRRSGVSKPLDSNWTIDFLNIVSSHENVAGYMAGIDTSATATGPQELSRPLMPWFAYSGGQEWSLIGGEGGIAFDDIGQGVVLNQVAADEIEAKSGDIIELSWYVTDDQGKRIRIEGNLSVVKVVPNLGLAAMAGTRSPAMFTTLALAQDLLEREDSIERIRITLDDPTAAKEIGDELLSLADEITTYSDVGFKLDKDDTTGVISISSTSGLGRLSSEFMDAWRENATTLSTGEVMEVLQIPLIKISHNYHRILSLPDDQINEILAGVKGDWYVSGGAVSYQNDRGGDYHTWQVPDGGLIADVALSEDGLLVASSTGLHLISSDPDEKVLELSEGDIAAVYNRTIFVDLNSTANGLDLPATVFDVQMEVLENGTWVMAEGLLSKTLTHLETSEVITTTAKWLSSDDDRLFLGDESGWHSLDGSISSPQNWTGLANMLLLDEEGQLTRMNSTGIDTLGAVHERCSTVFAVQGGDIFCTTIHGVLIDQSGNLTIRLPLSVDVASLGEIPQLLLAVNTSFAPGEHQLTIADSLELLGDDKLWLTGLVPYAYGDDTPFQFAINGTMTEIDAPGLDELSDLIIGMVNLSDGERLASAEEGERSMLIISSANLTILENWLDGTSDHEVMGLKAKSVKLDAFEAAETGAGTLSAMFLVFGTFTIIAGVLLVITIAIMLADERRSEAGVVRALGLKRADLRALAMHEGILSSLAASLLGAVFGLGLALIIGYAFSSVFVSAGASSLAFAASWNSMLDGAAYGFLISMATIWLTSLATSHLNIVKALKGGPISRARGIPWWLLLLIITSIGGGALAGLSLLTMDSSGPIYLATWHVAASLIIIGLVPLLTFVIPELINSNKGLLRWARRKSALTTLSTMGIILMLWAILPDELDPIRANSQPDELTFAVLGIIEVLAGVLIMVGLAPVVASWLGRRPFVTKRWGPLVPVSMAHPAATPLRTAVLMGMFSITVFSVVVLAGYSEQFEMHSSGYVEDASGDFEILLSSSRQSPLDLSENLSQWNLNQTDTAQIDAVGRVHRAVVWIEQGDERIPYVARGVDQGFIDHGAIPLKEWDESLGASAQDAWNSLIIRDDIAFVDSSFVLIDPLSGEAMSGMQLSIGDSIILIDISNPGNEKNIRIGGILSESSNLFSSGIWLDGEVVEERFGGTLTRVYISHGDEVSSSELKEVLAKDLSSEGVSVSVIEEEVLILQGLVFAILSIFQGYLALGLIVGIAGIGVVTVRSVSERSDQIGMLRALGYTRGMTRASLLIEVSWVAILGMSNGVVVAIGFHYAIYRRFWADQGVGFSIPLSVITWILIGGWILVILASIMPIRRAMNISPSEALRAVD